MKITKTFDLGGWITEIFEELWRDEDLSAARLMGENVLKEVVDVTHSHACIYSSNKTQLTSTSLRYLADYDKLLP
jgi:hypothetical protein